MNIGVAKYMYPSWDELKGVLQAHCPEINQMVFARIAEDPALKRYQVPVSGLKIKEVVLYLDYSLEYILEPQKE